MTKSRLAVLALALSLATSLAACGVTGGSQSLARGVTGGSQTALPR